MLVRLMYASRARVALRPQDLGDILRESRSRNLAAGITGLLWHANGLFMQVLEGDRSSVNELYRRIVGDRRHEGVELLAYHETAERRFAGWTMGGVDVHQVNPALMLKYLPQPQLDLDALTAYAACALFDDLIASACVASRD